ncbi:MAG TPA: polyphosphate kinase 2, partial [Rhodanobacter sp.]|nr:polyphosphate kinase 2 [Rhodanobacter sp.]
MGKRYRKAMKELQLDLIRLQHGLRSSGKRLLVIFEGRDAAGKGGTIKAITESLDTRGYRIVALPKPGEAEASQWYFQRYVAHLPGAGEFVLFDRSWYNRAVVEPAMGFCSSDQYAAFLDAVPAFEKLLADDGIILIKYWLAVDQAEQEKRFAERADDPLKRWK